MASKGVAAGTVVWLSHPLSENTPAYGGGPGFEYEPLTRIDRGDTANTMRMKLPNHLGTHVDLPFHFFNQGPDLDTFQAEQWVFRRPVLVDVDVPSGEIVGPEHVGPVPSKADLLLIRSGHGQTRGTDAYWQQGPGLGAELGRWLRRERPSVRAVGMDLISVTSPLRQTEGRQAHRAFLDPGALGSPILLIEDMALEGCLRDLRAVIVAPLRLAGADGAPVTVLGLMGAGLLP